MFDLSQFFNCYVLTIERGHERLRKFDERCAELGVIGYEVLYGVDGDQIQAPNWWGSDVRTFACSLSHMNALHRGIAASNGKPILIFEDDAYLRDNFIEVISEVIHYFTNDPELKVCYIGGRVDHAGEFVGRFLRRGAKVTGTYGYVVSSSHAPTLAAYILNAPPKKMGRHSYHNDVRMRYRRKIEKHTVVDPPCVGHWKGPSVRQGRMVPGRDHN
jgi:GR25 family glycosyltransferase involved in LPS biosynthesis